MYLFDLAIEERALRGLFLAFQYPLEIPGVNTSNFLKTSLNAIRKSNELGIDLIITDHHKIPERSLNIFSLIVFNASGWLLTLSPSW